MFDFISFCRNRFRLRNSSVTISSFRCDSQLSSRVSISSCRSSFFSGESDATHFALLKCKVGGVELEVAGFRVKNDEMLPFAFGLFASAVESERWLALRLVDVAMLVKGNE